MHWLDLRNVKLVPFFAFSIFGRKATLLQLVGYLGGLRTVPCALDGWQGHAHWSLTCCLVSIHIAKPPLAIKLRSAFFLLLVSGNFPVTWNDDDTLGCPFSQFVHVSSARFITPTKIYGAHVRLVISPYTIYPPVIKDGNWVSITIIIYTHIYIYINMNDFPVQTSFIGDFWASHVWDMGMCQNWYYHILRDAHPLICIRQTYFRLH